jgi:hypothetical protein
MDVHGVSLSTASSVDVQGVPLYTVSSVDVLSVPLLLQLAVWTCRVYTVVLFYAGLPD